MSRDVISIYNELDALSGRFNPDHVTYLRHHTQKLNGITLVNTLVEELANAPALTLPELYRKVEMLAGLCDADSHPHPHPHPQTGGPSEVRLLASIWADVAQLSPEYAGIRHVQTLSDVLRERAKEFEQVSPVPDEHCYTLALSEDLATGPLCRYGFGGVLYVRRGFLVTWRTLKVCRGYGYEPGCNLALQ